MGVTRKFSRGATLSRGGVQPLARTSFIRLKPIHIKESSDSRGGRSAPLPPPLVTPIKLINFIIYLNPPVSTSISTELGKKFVYVRKQKKSQNKRYQSMGVTRGGQGGALAPPLESELSSICIGFSLINDVRARGCPPPLENFLVTPMLRCHDLPTLL